MNPALHYADVLGKDLASLAASATFLNVDGKWSIPEWNEAILGAKPTDADLAEVIALPDPDPARVIPEVISVRQFFQQLAIDGDITQAEALAAVQTRALPQKLADAIASLPKSRQFSANMLVCGAVEFHRSNETVTLLGQALNKDADALDALWADAFAL